MKSVPLTAYPRTVVRRGGVKKLRASGRVPAVIYGRQVQPQNLELKRKEVEDLLHHAVSQNLLLDLSIEGDARSKRLAMMREIQRHPLSGHVLHVDLHEISENEKVTVQVPIETVGEPVGVKTGGGILEHVLFQVKVRAFPKDLPEQIVIDVSHLDIGKAVHIGEIKAPPGVEILGDKNIPVVAVAAPMTEEQEAAAAAAAEVAPGEVEMIKEKKEEGEAAPEEAKGEKAPAKGEKAPAKGAEKAAAQPGAAAPAEKKPAEKKPAEKKK